MSPTPPTPTLCTHSSSHHTPLHIYFTLILCFMKTLPYHHTLFKNTPWSFVPGASRSLDIHHACLVLYCMHSLPYLLVFSHPSSPSLYNHHIYHTLLYYLRCSHIHPMVIHPSLHTHNPFYMSLSLPSHTHHTLLKSPSHS